MHPLQHTTDFTELTAPMLHEFVDKILVHESDKSSGLRMQKIEVYLNFIGMFDVPPPDPTPEEIAEMEDASASVRNGESMTCVGKRRKNGLQMKLLPHQQRQKHQQNAQQHQNLHRLKRQKLKLQSNSTITAKAAYKNVI